MAQYTDNLNLTLPETTDFVNIQDINGNMETIDAAFGTIGTTTDTEGSTTTGTVMGKLNRIIGGDGNMLLKPSTVPTKTITTGLGNGFNVSVTSNSSKVTESGLKLMNCISFSRDGIVTVELEYAADSISTSNASMILGLNIIGSSETIKSFLDKPVGTVVEGLAEIGDFYGTQANKTKGIIRGETATDTTGTKTFTMTVKKGECYTPVLAIYATMKTDMTAVTETFRLTAVKIYYEEADEVIYL